MRRSTAAFSLFLAAYTTVLTAIEARGGGAAVRPFLEDPPGSRALGAINTELSAGLLGGAALLFFAAWRLRGGESPDRPDDGPYLGFQSAFWLLLALDERFRVVPTMAGALGLSPLILYASLVAAQGLVLLGPGRILNGSRSDLGLAAVAGATFLVAFGADRGLISGWALRHTIEDVPKVWGAAAIFALGWRALRSRVGGARAVAEAVGGARAVASVVAPAIARTMSGAEPPIWERGEAWDLGRRAGTRPIGSTHRPVPRLTELADPARAGVGVAFETRDAASGRPSRTGESSRAREDRVPGDRS